MSRGTLAGGVIALAAVACLMLIGVTAHELTYASDHPFRYGPAKVIATSAGAGALLSLAVALLAVLYAREAR